MNVERCREDELNEALAREILDLQRAAFPATREFAAGRWYHTPPADDDLWFVARSEGRPLGSVRVIHRTVLAEGRPLAVAGVANVCSHPAARGSGAAKACMMAAQEDLAHAGAVDFGLLFCGPEVVAFYTRLGWHDVANQIHYVDAAGHRAVASPTSPGHMMIYPGRLNLDQWPAGQIDLNGPDW